MDLSQLLRALGLQQAYQSYQQNIGQPFANIAGPFGRGLLGLERPEYGEEQAYRTGQAMGNMPAVSAPVGAFKAAAQVPGLLADATQAMKGLDLAGLLGLTAYHGSPYRFSKFDPTKIGSGEGAQAFGYGHYLAESPDVAQSYADVLASPRNRVMDNRGVYIEPSPMGGGKYMLALKSEVGQPIGVAGDATQFIYQDKEFPNLASAIKFARQKGLLSQDQRQKLTAIGEDRKYIPVTKASDVPEPEYTQFIASDPGYFYKVDIPDEMVGRMLDWDKPLGQQPQLKAVLEKIGKEIALPKMQDAEGAGFAYEMLANAVGGPKNASALLREYGIPGVAYLDQGSRGAGQGTRNFVVFPGEEEAIKILKIE